MSSNNKQAEFSDFLTRYLEADRATRVKAKAKADILNAAEKAGYSKTALKEVAALEKLEAGEREARLRTLMLYAHYSGHTAQIDLFETIDFTKLAMEVEESNEQGDGSEEADTKDIEEAVAEAEAEVEADAESADPISDEEWDASDPKNKVARPDFSGGQSDDGARA